MRKTHPCNTGIGNPISRLSLRRGTVAPIRLLILYGAISSSPVFAQVFGGRKQTRGIQTINDAS